MNFIFFASAIASSIFACFKGSAKKSAPLRCCRKSNRQLNSWWVIRARRVPGRIDILTRIKRILPSNLAQILTNYNWFRNERFVVNGQNRNLVLWIYFQKPILFLLSCKQINHLYFKILLENPSNNLNDIKPPSTFYKMLPRIVEQTVKLGDCIISYLFV